MKQTRIPAVTAVVLLVMALLGACGAGSSFSSGDRAEGGSVPQATQAAGPADGGYPQAPPDGTERMIILTQTLRFEVDDTPAAIAALRELADQHDALVANMRMASYDGWVYDSPASGVALRGWVTVRVPVDGVDAFVADLEQLGKLVYQAQTSDDVTQEHVDLSARLENLRAQEQRLRELVAQAANVEETLAVEQELWRVRGEIESLDAQVKYLERQAAMATVTVEFTEDGPVVQEWGFVRALRDGVRAAAGVLAFVITFVIASSPLWLLGLGIVAVIRSVRRRRRLAAAQADPTPASASQASAAQPGATQPGATAAGATRAPVNTPGATQAAGPHPKDRPADAGEMAKGDAPKL